MMRTLIGLGGLILLAAIFWAASAANFGASFASMTSDPWGVVTLIDLYLGFVLTSVVVFEFEGRRPAALAWIVPIFFLGNVLTAAWFVLRGARLLRGAIGPRKGRQAS